MKAKLLIMVSSVWILFFMFYGVSYAQEVKKSDSNVGIAFDESNVKEKEIPKSPIIDDGNNNFNNQLLPRTGELLVSLIFILFGISILIFVLGILSIRNLYHSIGWEG